MRAFIIIFLISGCIGPEKFLKYAEDHPEELAGICADKFPVKTVFVLGKPDTITKIVTGKPDTIPCPEPEVDPDTGKLDPGKVICPPAKTVTKEVLRIDTIFQENTAKVVHLTFQRMKETERANVAEKDRDKFEKKYLVGRNSAVVIGLITLILFYFLVRK